MVTPVNELRRSALATHFGGWRDLGLVRKTTAGVDSVVPIEGRGDANMLVGVDGFRATVQANGQEHVLGTYGQLRNAVRACERWHGALYADTKASQGGWVQLGYAKEGVLVMAELEVGTYRVLFCRRPVASGLTMAQAQAVADRVLREARERETS